MTKERLPWFTPKSRNRGQEGRPLAWGVFFPQDPQGVAATFVCVVSCSGVSLRITPQTCVAYLCLACFLRSGTSRGLFLPRRIANDWPSGYGPRLGDPSFDGPPHSSNPVAKGSRRWGRTSLGGCRGPLGSRYSASPHQIVRQANGAVAPIAKRSMPRLRHAVLRVQPHPVGTELNAVYSLCLFVAMGGARDAFVRRFPQNIDFESVWFGMRCRSRMRCLHAGTAGLGAGWAAETGTLGSWEAKRASHD